MWLILVWQPFQCFIGKCQDHESRVPWIWPHPLTICTSWVDLSMMASQWLSCLNCQGKVFPSPPCENREVLRLIFLLSWDGRSSWAMPVTQKKHGSDWIWSVLLVGGDPFLEASITVLHLMLCEFIGGNDTMGWQNPPDTNHNSWDETGLKKHLRCLHQEKWLNYLDAPNMKPTFLIRLMEGKMSREWYLIILNSPKFLCVVKWCAKRVCQGDPPMITLQAFTLIQSDIQWTPHVPRAWGAVRG